MTVTSAQSTDATPVEMVTLTIDGIEVSVPKGTLVIRAAELVGIQIPRFCDHPLLDPVGACRQCLVEIEGQRKPMASCTVAVGEGMEVKTQLSSPVAEKAQRGIIEMLLINHPLDCPICDKGGECPLQNQSMSSGDAESRFLDVKRTYPKPLAISSQVLLDRERCVLCARCTRFQQQVVGDPFIELFERSALEQVAIASDTPFASYFSGNTIQICPVGALTGASYRFRARPFDLVSTPTICEHCASGCAMRTDHRRGTVTRRLAGDDPEVNEEWNCDKGRWAFAYSTQPERLTSPLVRDAETGQLRVASWTEALERAAEGLSAAGSVGVLPGGRVTLEDAYGYAKFARVALGTHDVDHRARPSSAEEAQFLAHAVAGTGGHVTGPVTYADLERVGTVVLAGFEPEEESPIVFLRLRKAVRKRGLTVHVLAPLTTRGSTKMSARMVPTVPGAEAQALAAMAAGTATGAAAEAVEGLRAGGVLLLGERLAQVPGALSAALALAEAVRCRIAWVPRRAGERGAVEAGTLPGLLPGGRPADDTVAAAALAAAWGLDAMPTTPGRDLAGMLAAAAQGSLGALVVGGVQVDDLPDPVLADAALDAAFVVSLEVSISAVTSRADVVLPVAPAMEKAGTFVDWEGRPRPFAQALRTSAMPDARVLHLLAAEMGVALGLPDVAAARAELERLGRHTGARAAAPTTASGLVPRLTPLTADGGELVLASWHHLLDDGALQVGEPNLAGTAPAAAALLNEATMTTLGVRVGDPVRLTGRAGSVTLPVAAADVADRVVWIPTYSTGSHLHRDLGVSAGELVRITPGGAA